MRLSPLNCKLEVGPRRYKYKRSQYAGLMSAEEFLNRMMSGERRATEVCERDHQALALVAM